MKQPLPMGQLCSVYCIRSKNLSPLLQQNIHLQPLELEWRRLLKVTNI